MNREIVSYILAKLMRIEAALLGLPLLVGLIYKESYLNLGAFFLSMIILVLLSLVLSRKEPRIKDFYMREAFVIVGLGWILLSFFGGLPFYFSGEIPSLVDAFFETASGFTTTGSSILEDIEALSQSMLFWRSLTHMIGGMGILVFALALIPRLSGSGVKIYRAEVTGPSFGKLVSKLSLTAKTLYLIYVAMTAIVTLLLLAGGMNLFDALIHAFGAAGTGGFSSKALSIAYYDSLYIEMVLAGAMLVFGINFSLHYLVLLGSIRGVLKNEELRWYLSIVLISTLLIAFNISPVYGALAGLRHSFFAVSSVITTTGYATVDFALWPLFSRFILILLMVVGGSAGSTAGGLKVSRLVVLVKSVLGEILKSRQPKRVISLSLEGRVMDRDKLSSIQGYFALYCLLVLLLSLIISLDLKDMESALSGAITALSNIGPGLASLGPRANFSSLSDLSKLALSLAMIAGRLEIFPILVLFLPSTWKRIL